MVAVSDVFTDCLVLREWQNPFLSNNRYVQFHVAGRLQLFSTHQDVGVCPAVVVVYTEVRGRKEQVSEACVRALVLRGNPLGWQPAKKGTAVRVFGGWEDAFCELDQQGAWHHHVLFEYPRPEPPEGAVIPPRDPMSHDGFARDAAVRAWALRRARGHCEGCGCLAPFITRDGEPYLESHHIRRLADGGSDTVDNVAALCPNCHREVHLGLNADVLRGRLLEARARD